MLLKIWKKKLLFPDYDLEHSQNVINSSLYHVQPNLKIPYKSIFPVLMLGLHRITTKLGPLYELKNSGFLGLVSSC